MQSVQAQQKGSISRGCHLEANYRLDGFVSVSTYQQPTAGPVTQASRQVGKEGRREGKEDRNYEGNEGWVSGRE